jgi:hypothetical protein
VSIRWRCLHHHRHPQPRALKNAFSTTTSSSSNNNNHNHNSSSNNNNINFTAPGDDAAIDTQEGLDPVIYLLLLVAVVAIVYYLVFLRRKDDNGEDDQFFTQLDGEKVGFWILGLSYLSWVDQFAFSFFTRRCLLNSNSSVLLFSLSTATLLPLSYPTLFAPVPLPSGGMFQNHSST